MVQLPFVSDYDFEFEESISKIRAQKNVDRIIISGIEEPNILKHPTVLGIATLLAYYGIDTKGKHVALVGKGMLTGSSLLRMFYNDPYFAKVNAGDIYTN